MLFSKCLEVSSNSTYIKTGDPANVTNYGPISILPVVSKVIEKVVCNQLVQHLNLGHFPLHPMQFGFGYITLRRQQTVISLNKLNPVLIGEVLLVLSSLILKRLLIPLIIMFFYLNYQGLIFLLIH